LRERKAIRYTGAAGGRSPMKEKELRAAIVAAHRAIAGSGLDPDGGSEISARIDDAMLISPSRIGPADLRADLLTLMPLDGEYGAWRGRFKPADEWRLHLDVMRAKSEVNAIVRCRPVYATTLAMLKKPILAAHYLIAAFGGPTIRCTEYAPYGTKELADLAYAALEDRHGALLGNHGMIVTGGDLNETLQRAAALERLAHTYYLALAAGRPNILPDVEVMRIVERFKTVARVEPIAANLLKEAPRKKTRTRKAATKSKSTRRRTKKP
jgi:L-fuculose-phosphate aldolase